MPAVAVSTAQLVLRRPLIAFPVDRFGFCPTPSSRGDAEAIQDATSPESAEPWIACASPRNDEGTPRRSSGDRIIRCPVDPFGIAVPRHSGAAQRNPESTRDAAGASPVEVSRGFRVRLRRPGMTAGNVEPKRSIGTGITDLNALHLSIGFEWYRIISISCGLMSSVSAKYTVTSRKCSGLLVCRFFSRRGDVKVNWRCFWKIFYQDFRIYRSDTLHEINTVGNKTAVYL